MFVWGREARVVFHVLAPGSELLEPGRGVIFKLAGYFSSNRRAVDQVPGVPSAAFARTRHHIVSVGNPDRDTLEVATVCETISGGGKVFLVAT